MLATTTPNSWSAQFFYVLARFGLGLDGLAAEDEGDASEPGLSRR
jgi:hypothetical protein